MFGSYNNKNINFILGTPLPPDEEQTQIINSSFPSSIKNNNNVYKKKVQTNIVESKKSSHSNNYFNVDNFFNKNYTGFSLNNEYGLVKNQNYDKSIVENKQQQTTNDNPYIFNSFQNMNQPGSNLFYFANIRQQQPEPEIIEIQDIQEPLSKKLIFNYSFLNKNIVLYVPSNIIFDENTKESIDFLIHYLSTFIEYYMNYRTIRNNMDPFFNYLNVLETQLNMSQTSEEIYMSIMQFIKDSMTYLLKVKKVLSFPKKKFNQKFLKTYPLKNPELISLLKDAWSKNLKNRRILVKNQRIEVDTYETEKKRKDKLLQKKISNNDLMSTYNVSLVDIFPFDLHFQTFYFNLIDKMQPEEKAYFRDIYDKLHYSNRVNFLYFLVNNIQSPPYFNQIYFIDNKKPYTMQSLLFLSPYININDYVLNKYLQTLKRIYLYFKTNKKYQYILENAKRYNTNYELVDFLLQNIFTILREYHDETTPMDVIYVILEPIRDIIPHYVEQLVKDIQTDTMKKILSRSLALLQQRNHNSYVLIKQSQNKKDLDTFLREDVVPGLSKIIPVNVFESIFYKLKQDHLHYYKVVLSIFKKKQKEYAQSIQ